MSPRVETLCQQLTKRGAGNLGSQYGMLLMSRVIIIIDRCSQDFSLSLVLVKRASEIGDNFASDVYRISILSLSNKEESVSTFAKVLPRQRGFRNVARIGKTHDREILIYQRLLPLYLKMIEGKKEIVLKVPKLYYSRFDGAANLPDIGDRSPFEFIFEFLPEDGSERVLVIEDLKVNSFIMQPKTEGHTLELVSKTLKALAHWHAVGCAFIRENGCPPLNMEFFREKTVYDSMGDKDKFFEVLREVLERSGENKLADIFKNKYLRSGNVLETPVFGTNGVLETIVHGDFWNNNILYRISEPGKVEDLMMIDFQISRIGHPCEDLGFYLFGNTTAEFRDMHLTDLLQDYYKEVCKVLVILGHNVEEDNGYSFDNFLDEWKQRLLRMFMQGTIVIASITSKKDEIQSSMDKGEDMIERIATMLATMPEGPERDEMTKKIQEHAKEENFMANPNLLLSNKLFLKRFIELANEVLT
ncbi:uncharacterized protein LOC136042939 isoform X1 [Artemia franciscana]|uniref:uncharacterized protein LOC136042939 isoform X1 n=1 Tax=Artemia franciscana TaxID=6661 RepID=UPI0032D9EB59